jgi:hypothetical protein
MIKFNEKQLSRIISALIKNLGEVKYGYGGESGQADHLRVALQHLGVKAPARLADRGTPSPTF